MGERVRLGTAEGKERHWLYVCPECGTHTLDASESCDGNAEPHDPVPFERVRIVDAKDYDELDERFAKAQARVTELEGQVRELREAAERLMGALYWTLRTPGHSPYDAALQAARENVSEVLEALFDPNPDTLP